MIALKTLWKTKTWTNLTCILVLLNCLIYEVHVDPSIQIMADRDMVPLARKVGFFSCKIGRTLVNVLYIQGSNSSTLSWTSLQALRRIANNSRAGSIVGKLSPFQSHLYEHSMTYGDSNPDEYRQTLVESYLQNFSSSLDLDAPPTSVPPLVPPPAPPLPNLLAISSATTYRRGSPVGNTFKFKNLLRTNCFDRLREKPLDVRLDFSERMSIQNMEEKVH